MLNVDLKSFGSCIGKPRAQQMAGGRGTFSARNWETALGGRDSGSRVFRSPPTSTLDLTEWGCDGADKARREYSPGSW